jgi:NADH dehydrogenase
MKASALAHVLAERTGVALDVFGRVKVTEHLTVPGQTDILVIGDLAYREDQAGTPLPGICPVAIQQGGYAAKLILNRLKDKPTKAFRYVDKGSMAVIGRHAAVVKLGRLKFGGFPAWLTWIFIHIAYLIEFDNKLVVLVRWAWNYLTKKKGARLITNRVE